MLRQISKNFCYYRSLYVNPFRLSKTETCDSQDYDNTTGTNATQNSTALVKKNNLCNFKLNEKPVTAMPFEELSHSSEKSKIHDIAEFIDTIGPPLPISFNLAAYVNESVSLQKLVQLGVNLSVIEKNSKNAKFILNLDFEKDMKNHIQLLHDHGVKAELLGRFITKNPLIFKESIEDLKIRVNYLKSKNFSNDAISRIISGNPVFLSLSTKTVDSRLGFLQKQFSLSGDEVRYVIAKAPKLITYEFTKFTEKLFAMKEELGFNSKEMKILLLEKPKIWIIGRPQLRERFLFIHNKMGISHEHLLAFPGILLTRLFILKQRHEYLIHLKRAQYDPKQPMYISLKEFSTTTDKIFCEKCAKTSVEEYNEFLRTL